MRKKIRIQKRTYRNIFIVQNRDFWADCPYDYDRGKDLVLSFDFAVVRLVTSLGGEAQYLDHIVCSDIAEKYNYKTYDFFGKWHLNDSGRDIFNYKNIDVGNAFRIEIWNDITFYVRIFINLHELIKRINFESFFAGIDNSIVYDILEFMKIPANRWSIKKPNNTTEYYFPIFQWMDEKLHPQRIKYKVKVAGIKLFQKLMNLLEYLKGKSSTNYVYIEKYHPTKDIILEIKKKQNISVVRSDFNSIADMTGCIPLPVFYSSGSDNHSSISKKLFEKFEAEKCAAFFIDDIDISSGIYKLILTRISPIVAQSLMLVDMIIDFFKDRKLCLMVTFSNIGIVNRLMIDYCQKNNIPIYLIINGFLLNSFMNEAKEGDWINSYSESIKMNYFQGMDNIVCLGDPRMDKYAMHGYLRRPVNEKPTIGIAASGFTNVDLNCHLAIEFEFVDHILKACKILKKSGREMDIVIKIRPNGYMHQYTNFLKEYHPEAKVELFDDISMEAFYKKVDFLISIYSQTLFEASCLRIPVLYYKNDTQTFHPPFDGNSEIVTAFSPDDLINKMEAFYNGDRIYDFFKEKKVMEKYIGPLDGYNLKRNMEFIDRIISGDIKEGGGLESIQ